MFTKKKKKPQISMPSNFEHRVHTGFDKNEGRYVGLPKQWASIVGNNQILKSTNRPLPLVDPSEITHTEILDLKTIVRPHNIIGNINNNNNIDNDKLSVDGSMQIPTNGYVLPKTSHVARSNSLRSSSPPRMRRDLRGNANVPPAVPEEPTGLNQFPSIRREGIPPPVDYANKPKRQSNTAAGSYLDNNNQSNALYVNNSNSANNINNNNGPVIDQKGFNGVSGPPGQQAAAAAPNASNALQTIVQQRPNHPAHAINVRTDMPATHYR